MTNEAFSTRAAAKHNEYLLKTVGFLPAIFRQADLTNANFAGANLSGADFTGATLTKTDFTAATVDKAIFDG